MAANAAFPGLFFCFAATVLLVIVSVYILISDCPLTPLLGVYIIPSMGENILP
jgi:hypothetical protein